MKRRNVGGTVRIRTKVVNGIGERLGDRQREVVLFTDS
jgi:hypothetical protein